MSQPFFSLCVPVYNAESYLETCLSSIINQTFTDIEVIVINDGSTDGSQAVIESYKGYPFVRVFQQDNQGIFHTRLKALEEAKGQYVVWLDADDYLELTALQSLFSVLSSGQVDMVIYNHYDVLMDGTRRQGEVIFQNKYFDLTRKHEVMEQFILTSKLTALWRKAIRRELFDMAQMIKLPRATMGDDWLLSYYPLLASETIAYIDNPLINYRILPTSLTSQYDTGWYETLSLVHDLSQQWLVTVPESRLTSQMIDFKYLVDLSKALAYIPGQVKDKDAYLDMLRKIAANKALKELYIQQKKQLSFLYRLPFILLYSNHHTYLLQIKRLSAILRKRS